MSAEERRQIDAIITRLDERPTETFGSTLAVWSHQSPE
jgi:hypothetical protein